MKEGDYLIVDPACEVIERGTRDKNDGNEVVDNRGLPVDLMPKRTGTAQNKLKLTKEYNLITT